MSGSKRGEEHHRGGGEHQHLRAQTCAASLRNELAPRRGEAERRVIQHHAGGTADEKQRRLPPAEHGIQVQRAEDEPCDREPDRPRVQRSPFSYRHSAIERTCWIHHRLTPPAIVILIEPFNRFSGVLDPTTSGSMSITVRSASR